MNRKLKVIQKYLMVLKNFEVDRFDWFDLDEAYKLKEHSMQQRAYKLSQTFLDSVSENDKNVIAVIRKHRGMAYFSMNDYKNAFSNFDVTLLKDFEKDKTMSYLINSINKETNEKII